MSDISERLAVAESLVNECRDAVDSNRATIMSLQSQVIKLDSKWAETQRQLEDMSEASDKILDKIDSLTIEMRQKQASDKKEKELEEQERKRYLAILGTIGAIFVALVEHWKGFLEVVSKLVN